MNRRDFLKITAMGTAAIGLYGCNESRRTNKPAIPSYLHGYETAYAADPRSAALAWFADAKFGLFMHYGLYSLLGRREWVQFDEKIPVAEYEKLKERFTAEKFDPDAWVTLDSE